MLVAVRRIRNDVFEFIRDALRSVCDGRVVARLLRRLFHHFRHVGRHELGPFNR